MADRIGKETRSRNMSKIRSRGNRSTEKRMRSFLASRGVSGWKLHADGIAGNPDFAFLAPRIAVFVDGCFWHGCPICGHYPKSNEEYWNPKLKRNIERDSEYNRKLNEQGWIVVRVWEHEIKNEPDAVISRIREALAASQRQPGQGSAMSLG